MDPYRPTILGPGGSAEVEEELRNGSPSTPERRATFERMRRRADDGAPGAAITDSTPPPDHEGFVEVRSTGLREMRQKLATRRKRG